MGTYLAKVDSCEDNAEAPLGLELNELLVANAPHERLGANVTFRD